jgi:hypothetical protein
MKASARSIRVRHVELNRAYLDWLSVCINRNFGGHSRDPSFGGRSGSLILWVTVNALIILISDLPTGRADIPRDGFVVTARAPRVGAGREASVWAVDLVVRVEARVAVAFGFALDVIAL